MPEINQNWYYAQSGERLGPFSMKRIKNLITEGTVGSDTLVSGGGGDWIPAKDSDFGSLFNQEIEEPPPLPGSEVSNVYVWLIAVAPIILAIVESRIGQSLIIAYWIVYSILAYLDYRKLKAAGYPAVTKWWIFLVPVYLWKRATQLNQSRAVFWWWIALVLVSVFIAPV